MNKYTDKEIENTRQYLINAFSGRNVFGFVNSYMEKKGFSYLQDPVNEKIADKFWKNVDIVIKAVQDNPDPEIKSLYDLYIGKNYE